MDKQEKIVCAAIQFQLMDYENDGFFPPQHVCGVDYEFIEIRGTYTTPIMGFATSENRFVDPIEAQQIAITCGQYRDPHARIKSLEESIEIGWDSVKYAKTGVMISSLKKRIAEDQATLDALKAGYLGNALRVEDLHYV